MTEVIQATLDASASCRAFCPEGYEIRIVSVLYATGGMASAEQGLVRFARDASTILLNSATGQVGAGGPTCCAKIGGIPFNATQSNIDPVTGDVSLSDPATMQLESSLPDVWWPFDIVILVSCGAGTVGGSVVIYERRKR